MKTRLLVFLVFMLGKPALAQRPATASLTGSDVGCISESTLEERVNGLLGRPVVNADGDLRVVFSVVQGDPRWSAEIALVEEDGDAAGVRHLDAPAHECAQLREAMAIVIATMVDVPAREPLHLPERSTRQVSRVGRTIEAAPDHWWRLEVATVAEVGGFLPSGGGSIATTLAAQYWLTKVIAEVIPPHTMDVGPGRAAVRSFVFRGETCLRVGLWIQLLGCASVAAGRHVAEGFAFARNRRSSSPRLELGAGVGLAWWSQRSPVGVELSIGTRVPFTRPSLAYQSAGSIITARESGVVVGRITLAMLVRLGSSKIHLANDNE